MSSPSRPVDLKLVHPGRLQEPSCACLTDCGSFGIPLADAVIRCLVPDRARKPGWRGSLSVSGWSGPSTPRQSPTRARDFLATAPTVLTSSRTSFELKAASATDRGCAMVSPPSNPERVVPSNGSCPVEASPVRCARRRRPHGRGPCRSGSGRVVSTFPGIRTSIPVAARRKPPGESRPAGARQDRRGAAAEKLGITSPVYRARLVLHR